MTMSKVAAAPCPGAGALGAVSWIVLPCCAVRTSMSCASFAFTGVFPLSRVSAAGLPLTGVEAARSGADTSPGPRPRLAGGVGAVGPGAPLGDQQDERGEH